MSDEQRSAAEFWDDRYREKEAIWSGNVNQPLVKAGEDLAPGTALDLGCGEGADAIWLAGHGWKVTAVDVSAVALERTAAAAAERGLGELVTTERHDFGTGFPTGHYDLVSAQYLHSPIRFDREAVLRKAAAAVAPDGHLLIVEHAAPPPWSRRRREFPTAAETLESLALDPAEWELLKAGISERETTSPDGEPAVLKDNVSFARRLAG